MLYECVYAFSSHLFACVTIGSRIYIHVEVKYYLSVQTFDYYKIVSIYWPIPSTMWYKLNF